jgi:predicted TIM-barrel enzyme
MRKRFTREEIIGRLKKSTAEGKPIIGAGCSAGIIAKCAEIGGADLVIVYSTGKSRLMGLPTTRMGDMVTNDVTMSMAAEILNVLKDTPVVGGAAATDPTRMDLSLLLEQFMEAGYSGIINFPTILSYSGQFRRGRESVGLGFSREIEMLRLARKAGIFTMAYVYSPEEAQEVAKVHVDCIVPHIGGTSGGLSGFKGVESLKNAAEMAQKMIEAAMAIDSDTICLSHGGPLATPEDTEYIYEHTDALGYVGASSIERIPVENAVMEVVKKFKAVGIGKRQ